MSREEIPLRGLHNVENMMAAACATRIAGATPEQIRAAVKTFPGVEHRIEFVRKLNGVDYYNDSKATNVDATLKAIDSFDRGLWIILGGKDKGSDYSPLRAPLTAKAHAALLIGEAADKIARTSRRRAAADPVRRHSKRQCAPRAKRRSPATRSCSRPPARASTSSAASSIGAKSSSTW